MSESLPHTDRPHSFIVLLYAINSFRQVLPEVWSSISICPNFFLCYFPSFFWIDDAIYRHSMYSAIRMKLCSVLGQLFVRTSSNCRLCVCVCAVQRSVCAHFFGEINNSCWMSIVNGHRLVTSCARSRFAIDNVCDETMATQLGQIISQCLVSPAPSPFANATKECHSPSPPPIIAAYLSHLSSSRFDVCVTQSFFSLSLSRKEKKSIYRNGDVCTFQNERTNEEKKKRKK